MTSIRSLYNTVAAEYIHKYSNDLSSVEPAMTQFIHLLPQNAAVLDVGCGSGAQANWLFEHGIHIKAIDISDAMVAYALAHFPQVQPTRSTLFDIHDTFDGVWCCRVFHHIPLRDQDAFLDHLQAILRTDGILYLTVAHGDVDAEDFTSTGGSLKKCLTKQSFLAVMQKHNFVQISSSDWSNGWAEYFYKKVEKL